MFDALSKLVGKDKHEMSLTISGLDIAMESAEFVRTMDTGANALSCTMPWTLGKDRLLDQATAPFSYSEAKVFIGGDWQADLILYDVLHRSDVSGTVKDLSLYSKTADLIDSTVQPPFEQNNVDLLDRCRAQSEKFDIYTDVERTDVDVGGKFARVSAEQTDNCFEHLKKLAEQRGCLLTCDKRGELAITSADIFSPPVGTIFENLSPETEVYEMLFSGRGRYNRYDAIMPSARQSVTGSRQQSIDTSVNRKRFLTFSADDSLPGEGVSAANWRRNKSAAESLDMEFPVTTWYAPNGKLWQPNTRVVVISPTMNIKKGFTFLISRVVFGYSVTGSTAVLTLRPPSLYTGGDLVEPWN